MNGELLKDPLDISNALNKHFVNVGKKIQNSLSDKAVNVDDVCTDTKPVDNVLKFKLVTEMEICRIVELLKAKSSSGVDMVSNILLK